MKERERESVCACMCETCTDIQYLYDPHQMAGKIFLLTGMSNATSDCCNCTLQYKTCLLLFVNVYLQNSWIFWVVPND